MIWNSLDFTAVFPSIRTRWELLKFVKPFGIGVELGVASGAFSRIILDHSALGYLYSIDMYANKSHTTEEYKRALRLLSPHKERNQLLRMRFDEALDLFPDEHFDFIYVDGFASTGEEDGKTMHDWYMKLAPGGLMGGHDYGPEWPLVIKSADRFAAEHELQLFTVGGIADKLDPQNRYPSWFVVKPLT